MNAAEVEYQVLAKHLFGHIDKRHIRAYGIPVLVGCPILGRLRGHAWTVSHEGVVDVDVYRRTVALCLPVAGHGDLAPPAHIIILAVEVNRPFLRITAPMEQPLSVEANDFLTLFFF